MISQEIRRKFLKYFKDRNHTILPSSPVVPHDDPSLLFTNAGMNQFKDVFLGKNQRDYTRAATAQKCIRGGGKHNDLDNVGHTSRHLTFFEMLGNFSFGDYFKKESIHFAWEVSTSIFEFDPDKIWPTIFETDDEAYAIWEKIVPAKRIIRLGEKENFWAMGDTGPCGPCSELLYDRGSRYGDAPTPKEDASGERYLEFWNLVFMQFNRDAHGKMEPLPKKSIDTGAGLERLVSIKMGVDSLFATDIIRSLIAQVETVSQKTYDPKNRQLAPAFHVIADHIRSLSFAIADGAQPSNVERGYVLRKLLRRAVRYGRMIGLQEPFLAKVLPRLVDLMGEDYPELRQSQGRIAEILTLEEEAFIRTLKRGGDILNSVIQKAHTSPLKQITGDDAFKLKDTYGLPLEEIVLIAKDSELQVDLDSYAVLEEQAKEKSRASKQTHGAAADSGFFEAFLKKQGASHFTGYSEKVAESSIVAILKNGDWTDSIQDGEEAMIFLDKTPFYAEKGGQVGDTGTLFSKEALFAVSNCLSPFPNLVAHVGKMEKGTLKKNDTIHAQIDSDRRSLIQNNHTATHLLHWALQHILGPHIRQAGSVVDPSRLRFDFNHHKSLSQEELRSLEDIVNQKIRENNPVKTYEISYEEAQKQGEIKQFFGDKYGAKVRVVDIDFSKELCGGTHVKQTGDIGYFRILKESSIAAGVRRIEAVTGREAEMFARELENAGQQAAALIKSPLLQLPEKMALLIEENKRLGADLKIARRSSLKELAIQLSKKAILCGTAHFLATNVDLDNEEIGFLTEELGHHLKSFVLILATKGIDRCQLFVKVSPDLVQKGLQAVHLIKEIAPLVGGSGGGRADSAQAGGKQPDGIKAAFEKAQQIVLKQC